MTGPKRKKIPKDVKDSVWRRQRGGCACCIERGREYHHVNPVCLGGTSYKSSNIVLLCEHHHKLLHLGELDTCITILEYVYYLENWKLPDDINQIKEMAEKVKEFVDK